jgi:hypothetical protein
MGGNDQAQRNVTGRDGMIRCHDFAAVFVGAWDGRHGVLDDGHRGLKLFRSAC